MKSLLATIAMTLSASAAAQGPLGAAPVAGAKSQVLTIATVHLSGYDWAPAMLEPLLDKLVAFRPDIVTHEGLSGEQCYAMRSHPDLYGESLDSYCWNPDEIIAETRLSVPQAMLEVRKTLAALPPDPTAAQRRRLALLFLAAGDRVSARVQWLRLAPADRVAGDGLTDEMIAIIVRKGKKMNESYDVAAAVAARVGLERVIAVDDHTSDAALADVGPEYGSELTARYQEPGVVALIASDKAKTDKVRDAASMLDLFRSLNAKTGVDQALKGDFAAAIAASTPGQAGRKYFGWWEVRNLRMVANVRAAFAARPGARTLNIVGASHKPWYDFHFAAMPDVAVVDAAKVLR